MKEGAGAQGGGGVGHGVGLAGGGGGNQGRAPWLGEGWVSAGSARGGVVGRSSAIYRGVCSVVRGRLAEVSTAWGESAAPKNDLEQQGHFTHPYHFGIKPQVSDRTLVLL